MHKFVAFSNSSIGFFSGIALNIDLGTTFRISFVVGRSLIKNGLLSEFPFLFVVQKSNTTRCSDDYFCIMNAVWCIVCEAIEPFHSHGVSSVMSSSFCCLKALSYCFRCIGSLPPGSFGRRFMSSQAQTEVVHEHSFCRLSRPTDVLPTVPITSSRSQELFHYLYIQYLCARYLYASFLQAPTLAGVFASRIFLFGRLWLSNLRRQWLQCPSVRVHHREKCKIRMNKSAVKQSTAKWDITASEYNCFNISNSEKTRKPTVA